MINIDIELRRGPFSLRAELKSDARVTGLLGASGSGKTTLLHALAGLVRPVRGRITVNDEVFFDHAKHIDVPPERRRVGVVFQDGRVFPHLLVRENLLFGYQRTPPSERKLLPERMIELLELGPLLERKVDTLSGGESRRLAIGRALLTSPRLLVLDEPLTGLDPALRRSVLAYLMRLHEELDVRTVYVSHTLSDTLVFVDQAILVRDGKLEPVGAPELLLNHLKGFGESEHVESILQGTVETVTAGGDYATVRVGACALTVRLEGARQGQHTVVVVRAEDVLLTTDAPPHSSARNVLHGRILSLHDEPAGVLAVVDVGVPLYAALTGSAVDDLGLRPGCEVYALLKARALNSIQLPS